MTGPEAALWPSVPPVPPPATYPELHPPVAPLPLLARLPVRAKQRRWTVLLRAFMAIPLAVVVLFVGIAAVVCAVLGWFAALVTGRVPEFVRSIVTVYLRMTLRLEAYVFLLTDRFPPFSVDDVPAYPANLAVPPATRLHRAAVLFRLILVIPASIAVRVVGLGLYVIAIFMWIVVLITGWLPKPVHEVYEAFVRYELRLLGYFYLLVPTYPGELFGDLAPAPVLVPGDVSGQPFAASTFAPPQPPQQEPPQASPWMLILSMGAKRFLLVTIVLGIGAAIGLGVLDASLRNHENLVQVNNQLVANINQFTTTANSCTNVQCLEQADGVLSQQLGSFVSAIEGSSHAGVSVAAVNQVTAAAQNVQQVTAALATAGPSLSAYRSMAVRLGAQQAFAALGSAQHTFVSEVNAARFG